MVPRQQCQQTAMPYCAACDAILSISAFDPPPPLTPPQQTCTSRGLLNQHHTRR